MNQHGWGKDDATNPWAGYTFPPTYQEHNGELWRIGLKTTAAGFWPAFAVYDKSYKFLRVAADDVLAGLDWVLAFKLEGTNVKLFHSPAQGDLTIDGVTTTLYDTDPRPQLVPEPGTMAVVALGMLALMRRRRSGTR